MLAKNMYVFSEAGVPEVYTEAVLEAVNDVLSIVGINPRTKDAIMSPRALVKDMGCWRDEDEFLYDEEELYRQLIPYASIDWYVTNAMQDRATISGRKLMDLLRFGPYVPYEPDLQEPFRHYKVVLIQERLTHPIRPDRYVQGCVRSGQTLIMTTYGLGAAGDHAAEFMKTVAYHKLGHLFGLVSELRDTELKAENGAVHCINLCVMRQESGLDTLHRHTVQRLQADQPYCDVCSAELRMNYKRSAA
jgi:hypothetical protein